MFDLKDAVGQWKESLKQESPCSRADIRELEAHLQDLLEDLKLSGLSDEEAFALARHRVGDMPQIKQEFTKVNRPQLVRHAFLRMSLGWVFWAGIWAVVVGKAGTAFFDWPCFAAVTGGTLAILLVNFGPGEMWGIVRDTFRLATVTPGRHLQATLFWRTTTHALLATGALAFFAGIVLGLSQADSIASIGPYLAFSILGVLYALTFVCAVTIPGEALARKNGLDTDPARHVGSVAPDLPAGG